MTFENIKNNKTTTFLFRLSPIKKKQIDAVADELGLTSSQLIRLSVDNFIKGLD